MSKLDSVTTCSCGAVTLEIDKDDNKSNEQIPMAKETYDKHFAFLGADRSDRYTEHGCNHCDNHWGIDLDTDNARNDDGELIIHEVDDSIIDDIKSRL